MLSILAAHRVATNSTKKNQSVIMTTSKATFLPGAPSAKKYPLIQPTEGSFLNYGRTNDLYYVFTKDVKPNKY